MAYEENSIDTSSEEIGRRGEDENDDIDLVQLFRRIKSWHQQDAAHRSKWIKEADMDFAFVAGDQFTDEEKSSMLDSGRQPIVFNRCLTVIKSIAGSEINGRLDTRFLPRGVEDAQVNELLSATSEWMADQCDAEDEQSEAFESALICGMGWTEARISFDEDPQGMYDEGEIDPREMYWDCKARKKNLADARRRSRMRTISITDARQMFPDVPDEDLDATWATDLGKKEGETRAVEEQLHQGDDLNDVVAAEKTDVSILQIQWWERKP